MLLGPWWLVRPLHTSPPGTVCHAHAPSARLLYQGFDAHQVTLQGHPLVPMHFTNAFVISLELELQEVWGR